MEFPKTIYVNLQGDDLNAYEKLYSAVNDEGTREQIGMYELKQTLTARKIIESQTEEKHVVTDGAGG